MWDWKMNFYCFFCQKEAYNDKEMIPPKGVPYKPCDTVTLDINNKLTPVMICKECYNRQCNNCRELLKDTDYPHYYCLSRKKNLTDKNDVHHIHYNCEYFKSKEAQEEK